MSSDVMVVLSSPSHWSLLVSGKHVGNLMAMGFNWVRKTVKAL